MKKIVASLIVCGFAVAMVACGAKKEEAAAAVDSVATAVMDSTVEAVVDSVSAVVDSAAVVK
jgi:hypothetical protein